MIVGLEFDGDDDLVAAVTFAVVDDGRRWMRTGLRRSHTRSLYEVPRVRATTPQTRLVLRTLRDGRLLADRGQRKVA